MSIGTFRHSVSLAGGRWLLAALLVVRASPALGGLLLEEILAGLRLGAHTAARDEQRFCAVEPGQAVGQTFTVSPQADKVFRIALWQAFWHETWQPDEALVMTLWDGPEKRTAYGRCAIPYARRMWEGAVPMFTLDARVQPGRSYYFELTVEVEPLRPAETPREWLLSGQRPGFAGGDGKLYGLGTARGNEVEGCAYLGGQPQEFDLWFQVHERPRTDRDSLYRQAFGHFNLEHTALAPVRAAVQAADWDRAVDALIHHFEGRTDLMPPDRRQPELDPTYDTREADLAAEHRVLLEGGVTVDLGPEWNHYTLWPERGGVGLTRSGLRKYLSAAYAHTANEKYARAWNDMLAHFFLQAPSPLKAGVFGEQEVIPAALPSGLAGGSIWSGLSIGARLGHGFYYYAPFSASPSFTREVRAAFLFNLAEMAELLERMKGGGNWETQMAEALFDTGLTYPEFQGAPRWVQQGFDTLVANALSTVRPDGVLQEPSIGYHMLVMNRYSSVMERSKELGLVVPAEMAKLTEGMFEYVMYSALPDGTLPVWGDANHPMTPDLLERGARQFGRDDFLYVWSRGQQGSPPKQTSAGFPHSGYYYLRSGWEENAHYLAVRCGPYGSHGHRDTLSLIVSAFGNTILIDPGISTYGTPESRELTATASHNTVTLDGRDAHHGETDVWLAAEHFDFLAGHNLGYAGLDDARHYRRIWFLKPIPQHQQPGLWVVLDDVLGEGEHSTELRYRFAPLPVQADRQTGKVWTESAGGNLLVQVLEEGTQLAMGKGIAVWKDLLEVPTATFTREGPLPAAFTSVLIPFMRQDGVPSPRMHLLSVEPARDGTRAVWVDSGETAVLVACGTTASLQEEPGTLQVALPDGRELTATTAGIALRFVRHNDLWQPAALHGVRMQSAVLAGEQLFGQDGPAEVVEKVW